MILNVLPSHLPINIDDKIELLDSFQPLYPQLPYYGRNFPKILHELTYNQGVNETSLETCFKITECFKTAIASLPDKRPILNKYRASVIQLLFNRLLNADSIPKVMDKKACVKLFDETTDSNHVAILIKKINLFAYKITHKMHFNIAKRFAVLAPQALSSHLRTFDLNGDQHLEIAKLIIPVDRQAVVSNLENYKLTIADRVLLGIENPKENLHRVAPLGGLLLSVVENGIEDGSDPLEVHGYRRTLFIYELFLLCYNDNYFYGPADTELQYLKGNDANDVKGCHSAIIPNLARISKTDGVEDRTFSRRLYLFHAINSTMNLRTKVNQVDSAIEGHNHSPRKSDKPKLRVQTYDIVNQVADLKMPSYTPEHGLEDFLTTANVVANDVRERVFHSDDEKKYILAKEMKGMCSILNPDHRTIQDEFFKMHALISIADPVLKKTLREKPWSTLSPQIKDLIFRAQQAEILSHTIS